MSVRFWQYPSDARVRTTQIGTQDWQLAGALFPPLHGAAKRRGTCSQERRHRIGRRHAPPYLGRILGNPRKRRQTVTPASFSGRKGGRCRPAVVDVTVYGRLGLGVGVALLGLLLQHGVQFVGQAGQHVADVVQHVATTCTHTHTHRERERPNERNGLDQVVVG